ncbi:hypothetical protein [Anaeromyxobacter oryzae]|nr:hypothetical protein [Anaeromyxobacter oryzae]
MMDQRLESAVRRLCRDGAALAADGERAMALESYLEAWQLLPEPKDAPIAADVRAGIRGLVRGTAALERAAAVILREDAPRDLARA